MAGIAKYTPKLSKNVSKLIVFGFRMMAAANSDFFQYPHAHHHHGLAAAAANPAYRNYSAVAAAVSNKSSQPLTLF